jgi:hypothetical protein
MRTLALLVGVAICVGAVPSHAGVSPNGMPLSLVMPNGIPLCVVMPNGIMPNGVMPNGVMPNGVMPNGLTLAGLDFTTISHHKLGK